MLYRVSATLLVVTALVLGLIGCSGGQDLTSPQTSEKNAVSSSHQQTSWGMWDVTIDAETGVVETVPMRTADFNANVLRFLQPPVAPIELVVMQIWPEGSDLMEGQVAMDITLRHPFPGVRKWRGFDVRGIIMLGDGASLGKHDPNISYASMNSSYLSNPDGFTRWWNPIEFSTYGTIFGYSEGHFAHPEYEPVTTLNPYKLHTMSLAPDQPYYQMNMDERATFPTVDGAATRRYRLQFDMSTFPYFGFKYAIDASWSLPDPAYAPDYPVEAYDEMANCQEPYMVRVEAYEEIPYYVDEWVSGGDLQLLLTIGDWQATNGDVLDEISHVWLESPTLFENPVDVIGDMEFVDSPHPTQATYRIYLEDMAPDGLEGQQLMFTVESADPDSYEPQIQGDTSWINLPNAPLAAHFIADVPITNLAPQGEYAYVYFIPDWCATMRYQCANDADNQELMANIMSQELDGYYNDYTHVQVWEGKTNTMGQNSDALHDTCINLGYTFERTYNDYFDASGSRVVIVVALNTSDQPPNPPFTLDEATDMQEYIQNGGILFFMCEASGYFNDEGYDELFEWLGMLMAYGGGAEPEYSDGYTNNITWHWLTDNIETYHYYTCGTWISEDPHVLELVATEYDQKLVIMYPLPLE